jgi:hypothetical protein
MQPPIRRDDLVHSQAALRERLEECIARDKLSLANIEPFPFGFVFRPALSPRFRRWWETQAITQRFWLDSTELDPLGSQLLISREPFGSYAALCFWQDFTDTTNHLRVHHIGPALWEAHKTLLLTRIVNELAQKFGLIKRPLNSQQLPSYADAKWGILAQLKCPQAVELLEHYLCFPPPSDRSIPIHVKLGGNISCVLAFGAELARLGLCFNGLEDPALLDLQEWLRSAHKFQTVSATT